MKKEIKKEFQCVKCGTIYKEIIYECSECGGKVLIKKNQEKTSLGFFS